MRSMSAPPRLPTAKARNSAGEGHRGGFIVSFMTEPGSRWAPLREGIPSPPNPLSQGGRGGARGLSPSPLRGRGGVFHTLLAYPNVRALHRAAARGYATSQEGR